MLPCDKVNDPREQKHLPGHHQEHSGPYQTRLVTFGIAMFVGCENVVPSGEWKLEHQPADEQHDDDACPVRQNDNAERHDEPTPYCLKNKPFEQMGTAAVNELPE